MTDQNALPVTVWVALYERKSEDATEATRKTNTVKVTFDGTEGNWPSRLYTAIQDLPCDKVSDAEWLKQAQLIGAGFYWASADLPDRIALVHKDRIRTSRNLVDKGDDYALAIVPLYRETGGRCPAMTINNNLTFWVCRYLADGTRAGDPVLLAIHDHKQGEMMLGWYRCLQSAIHGRLPYDTGACLKRCNLSTASFYWMQSEDDRFPLTPMKAQFRNKPGLKRIDVFAPTMPPPPVDWKLPILAIVANDNPYR